MRYISNGVYGSGGGVSVDARAHNTFWIFEK